MVRAASRKKGGRNAPVRKTLVRKSTKSSRRSRVVGSRRSKRVLPTRSPRRRR